MLFPVPTSILRLIWIKNRTGSNMSEKNRLDLTSCKLYVSQNKDSKYYFENLRSVSYKEEEGWGFDDVEKKENVISAIYIHKVHSYYYIWDENLQTKDKRFVEIIKEIRFIIDFDKHLLIVEGKVQDMNAVKQGIRKVFWNHFVYDDLVMNPFDFFHLFVSENMLEDILEVTINDFEYQKQMVGRYIVKRIKLDDTKAFLERTRQTIEKIKFSLSFRGKEMEVVVKMKGRLCCQSKVADLHDFMLFVKDKIY